MRLYKRAETVTAPPVGPAALASALLSLAALPIGRSFIETGLASTGADAIPFFVSLNLFVAQDMWAGPVFALVLLAAWGWGWRLLPDAPVAPRIRIGSLVLLAALLSVALRFLVQRNYGPSLDEYMPRFQAEIFREGNLMAPLGDTAFAIRDALQMFFTYVDDTHRLWSQHYRPVHAAILALFPAHVDVALGHAMLTGITVLATADVARQVFPERSSAPLFAVALLLGSPQVLLTSASGFAFTAHLAFNAVWLALFLRGSWPAHVGAALIGLFALGIHQVHVHAIYVLPFGVAMLLGYFGSIWKTVPYIIAYGIGVPLWVTWPEIATWIQTGDADVLPRSLMEVEYLANYLDRSGTVGVVDRDYSDVFLTANLWRFALWMSPALFLLLSLAMFCVPRLGRVPVIAAMGFLLTVAISHVLLPNQMHTIGSRYYHAAILNVILVAMAAYYAFDENRRLKGATVALLVAGAVVFLPWRAIQIAEKVWPRAAIQAEFDAMKKKNVIFMPGGAWFMPDFIRNDPYLREGPFYYGFVDTEEIVTLTDGPRVFITGRDLVEMGLPRGTYLEPALEFTPR